MFGHQESTGNRLLSFLRGDDEAAGEGFNGKHVYAFLLQFYIIFLDNMHYLSFK